MVIEFKQPVHAHISIHQVKGNLIDSKRTVIHIRHLSATSIEFESELKFPVSEDVIYRLSTTLYEDPLDFYGEILTSVKMDDRKVYFYQFNLLLNQSTMGNQSYQVSDKQKYLGDVEEGSMKKIN
ncbi:hypothetical protein [Bacillus alkalicellulosilyticus]|uniref:hypothetical protein n=1 Tax=Alkalihalobacterium alkalicellulosilyticum TaxID=1912214 RepID=UPI00099848E1|nr:hypothetical protein [Bacillus alkalicellulosilyticus]